MKGLLILNHNYKQYEVFLTLIELVICFCVADKCCLTIIWSICLMKLPQDVFSFQAAVTCFKCDHMNHASSCNTTTKCSTGEVCAVRSFRGPAGEYQSSGCIDETKCTANAAKMVGKRHDKIHDKRQQDTLTCEKCCFGDNCNVLDCTRSTVPVCQDQVSQCSNPVYRQAICSDDNNAMTFCQKSCNKCPVNGGFSNWLQWTDCSVSCGSGGQSFRVRACDSPKPSNGGSPCNGATLEFKQCTNGPCVASTTQLPASTTQLPASTTQLPASTTQFLATTTNKKAASTMMKISTTKPPITAILYPSTTIAKKPLTTTKKPALVTQSIIAVDGQWSAWGQWLPCNATCGGGTTMRVRSCSNPVPRHGGKPCANPASFMDIQPCNTHACPIDGNWSGWGQWLPCNVTCGGGTSMRIRSCSNPVPRHGGKPCANPASFVETQPCNTNACLIDGHWSSWSQWQACQVTCGGGTTFRTRSCSNPAPTNGGKPCANPASSTDIQPCNTISCPITQGNTPSTPMQITIPVSSGSTTTATVTSTIASGVTKLGTTKPGAIDGHWSAWGTWLPCNATCGGGISMRVRSCSNPVPRYGGKPCANPASFIETKPCNTNPCTIPTSTASSTPNKKTTTSQSTTVQHLTKLISTSASVNSQGVMCVDKLMCSDPHFQQIACNDLYLSTTYCPRLCHICGPTSTPPTCIDLVGRKCKEHIFQVFTCADPDLVNLCRLSCGACH